MKTKAKKHLSAPSLLSHFTQKAVFVLLGSALLFPASTFAADELGFSFSFACPIDVEKCIPEAIPENKTDFFIANPELGKTLEISLMIQNPKAEMITSARAKLKYDPEKIDVLRISTDDSDFPLFAPGEKNIDREKGTVLLGGSLTSGSKSDAEFLFVNMTVKPKVLGAKLEFLNFQKSELGDTGILYTHGIDTENKLSSTPKPLVFQGGATDNPPEDPIDDDPLPPDDLPDVTEKSECERPMDLRIQTDISGKVRLLWPLSNEPCVQGYFVYYSQNSGFYIRRKDVGKTNFVEIEDFEKDKRYCFALTSYDANDAETDYSDEVCVVVGQPGTETAGFAGDPRDDEKEEEPEIILPVETGGKVADSGPATNIFFLLLLSAGMTLVGFAFRSSKN